MTAGDTSINRLEQGRAPVTQGHIRPLSKEAFRAQFKHWVIVPKALEPMLVLETEVYGYQVFRYLERLLLKDEEEYFCA